jgi:hypothetical protein
MHYEKRSKSRTYLFVDEEALANQQVIIIAYFTISLKTLFIGSDISKTKIKQLDGLFNKATNVSAYLIGQLGKNDLYKTEITGKEIIDYAINILEQVQELVGGRFVLIECLDKPKLIEFYTNNGFMVLQKDENDKLIQLVRFFN